MKFNEFKLRQWEEDNIKKPVKDFRVQSNDTIELFTVPPLRKLKRVGTIGFMVIYEEAEE